MKRMWLFSLGLIQVLFCAYAQAQTTRVVGRVTDASTGDPVQFANVLFVGTTTGVSTDLNGEFKLETRAIVSQLQVSMLGYQPQKLTVNLRAYNQLSVKLLPEESILEQVVIKPDDGPTRRLLKRVRDKKDEHNPELWDSYTCATYTKMEMGLNNIKPQFKNKKLQKNLGFIFQNMDTSILTGKAYLPAMISESFSNYFYTKNPLTTKELIRASRISGVSEDYTFAQFSGQLHGNINFYDNYIDILNIRFASPLSDLGTLYYKYYLVDSMYVEGHKLYRFRFHPKGLSTPVLDGEFRVDSATLGLYSVRVVMPGGSNINWLRHLIINEDYQYVQHTGWFKKKEELFADFSITVKDSTRMLSVLGTRTIYFDSVQRDVQLPKHVTRLSSGVQVSPNSLVTDPVYWTKVRPYALTEKEQRIYDMVDSIKRVPLYHDIYTILNMIFGGYYDTKYVGIGPYYKILSYNNLEGVRLQAGMKTTSDFSKRFRYSGYAAYGIKDQDLKGGGTVEWQLNPVRTQKITFDLKHDLYQLGSSENALTQGNFFSSLLARSAWERMNMLDQATLSYEHEWSPALSNTLSVQAQRLKDSPYVNFVPTLGGSLGHINSASVSLNTRLSRNEAVIRQTFDKVYFASVYPVISLTATAGQVELGAENRPYGKFAAKMLYQPEVPPFGYASLTLGGGTILGKVPFTHLKIHEGNGTYFYDPYAFSTMNMMEFASDSWVDLYYEHHFKGFFLGKIPLLKKLKWREVFVLKGTYGWLSDRNNWSLATTQADLRFPGFMTEMKTPFVETGFAVENIFKVLRVDAMWRLTHRSGQVGQKVQKFTINFSFVLSF